MATAEPALRALPSVNAVLGTSEARALAARLSPGFVAAEARSMIEGWRTETRAGVLGAAALATRRENAGAELERRIESALAPSLVPVINATGVVIHTNLGRAPWPEAVVARAAAAARGYTNLEYDLAAGTRGRREMHLASAHALFGAGGALVVNNNAAAILLVLNTLGEGFETVVSRGELVEIGGSFRIPGILAKSGSLLREVGTTNRTHLGDYEAAIGERTGLLLKVHPSNYRILGFTAEVGIAELAALGRRRGVPVVADLGSGDVVDLKPAGVGDETTVGAALAAGSDLVTFSGDKLLGGPQAGIIAGRADLVARLAQNPLYRALRPDKVVIAALEELFTIYRARDPWAEVPVLRMLAGLPEDLAARARRIAAALATRGLTATAVTGASTTGGGASPLSALPTALVAVTSTAHSAAAIEAHLRRQRPAVIARIEDDRILLDVRTVAEDEEAALVAAFPG